jgi:outer membrane protein TolC
VTRRLAIITATLLIGAVPAPGAAQPGEAPAQLTLSYALELAARNNETPQVAAGRPQRDEEARTGGHKALFPSLTLSGTYTRRAREVSRVVDSERLLIQDKNALSGSTVLEMDLLDLTHLPKIRRSERLLEATRLEGDELRRALAYDVAETYFAVLSAERLRDAAERRVDVAERTVSEASSRFEAGLADRNEVTRSELELATSRLARTTAHNAVLTTRLALGYLLGIEADGELVEPAQGVLPGREVETLEREALQSRPDLRALEELAEAAREDAREPWLRLLPTLGLRANYSATNEGGITGQTRNWNVAATLTWAIYDGGVRYAQAAARAATFREANLFADALRRRIALEIRTALSDLETSEAALVQAEVRLRVAEANSEEVRERFNNGLATALEQADAVVSEFEAAADLARQGFALRVAQLSLVRALGDWPGESNGTAPAGEAPEMETSP